MRISSIGNNTNFKGLWVSQNKKEGFADEANPRDRGLHDMIPMTYEEVIYRPFADESEEEINQAMINASRDSFMGVFDHSYYKKNEPSFYKVIQPKLGKRLSIKEKEYESLNMTPEGRTVGDMRETPHSMKQLGQYQYYEVIPMTSVQASDFMQFRARFDVPAEQTAQHTTD